MKMEKAFQPSNRAAAESARASADLSSSLNIKLEKEIKPEGNDEGGGWVVALADSGPRADQKGSNFGVESIPLSKRLQGFEQSSKGKGQKATDSVYVPRYSFKDLKISLVRCDDKFKDCCPTSFASANPVPGMSLKVEGKKISQVVSGNGRGSPCTDIPSPGESSDMNEPSAVVPERPSRGSRCDKHEVSAPVWVCPKIEPPSAGSIQAGCSGSQSPVLPLATNNSSANGISLDESFTDKGSEGNTNGRAYSVNPHPPDAPPVGMSIAVEENASVPKSEISPTVISRPRPRSALSCEVRPESTSEAVQTPDCAPLLSPAPSILGAERAINISGSGCLAEDEVTATASSDDGVSSPRVKLLLRREGSEWSAIGSSTRASDSELSLSDRPCNVGKRCRPQQKNKRSEETSTALAATPGVTYFATRSSNSRHESASTVRVRALPTTAVTADVTRGETETCPSPKSPAGAIHRFKWSNSEECESESGNTKRNGLSPETPSSGSGRARMEKPAAPPISRASPKVPAATDHLVAHSISRQLDQDKAPASVAKHPLSAVRPYCRGPRGPPRKKRLVRGTPWALKPPLYPGERLFRCDLCPAMFLNACYLQHHRFVHHLFIR